MDTSNDSVSFVSESLGPDSDMVMVPWEQQDDHAVATNPRRGTSVVEDPKETGDAGSMENHWLSHSFPSAISQYYQRGYRRADQARTMLQSHGVGDEPTDSPPLVSAQGRQEAMPMPSEDDMNLILEAAFPATEEIDTTAPPVSVVQVLDPGSEEEPDDDMSTLASETSILPGVVHGDDDDGYQPATNPGVSPATTVSLKIDDVISTVSENLWKVVESDKDDSKEEDGMSEYGQQNSDTPSESDDKMDQSSSSSRKATSLPGLSPANNAIANIIQKPSSDRDEEEASGTTMQKPTSGRDEEEASEQEYQVIPEGHSPETSSYPKPPYDEQAWDSNAFIAVGETLLQSTTCTAVQHENYSNAQTVTEPVDSDTPAKKRWWLNRKSFMCLFSLAIALVAFVNGRGMDETGIKSRTPSALEPTAGSLDVDDTQVWQCVNDTGAVVVSTLPELAQVVWDLAGDIVSIEGTIVPSLSPTDSAQKLVGPLETVTHSYCNERFPPMIAGTDKDHDGRKTGSLSMSSFCGAAAIAYVAAFACFYRCLWGEHLAEAAAPCNLENERAQEPHLDGDTNTRNYDTMSRVGLKELARARGLPVGGLKRELIRRIVTDYHRELDALSYRQLQRRCHDNNVTKTGTRQQLIRRLLEKGL